MANSPGWDPSKDPPDAEKGPEVKNSTPGTTEDVQDAIAIQVQRSAMDHGEYLEKMGYEDRHGGKGFLDQVRSAVSSVQPKYPKCSWRRVKKWAILNFPILEWLPAYNIKGFLPRDIVSGLTVGIMHISQGLGFAQLAGVAPVYGLYMALIPSVVYTILGTSKHVSIGAMATNLYMVGAALDSAFPEGHEPYPREEAFFLMAFGAGLWQLALGLTKLGTALSVMMPEILMSGLTTGASFLVVSTQIPPFFGLEEFIKKDRGFPKHFLLHYYVLKNMNRTNLVVMFFTAISAILVAINHDFIKPAVQKRCPYPVPVELVIMIVGVAVSYWLQFHEVYDVRVVGEIPLGFPGFRMIRPLVLLIRFRVIIWTFVIAVVTFVIDYSVGTILSKKYTYFVRPNQELIALGTTHVIGSFFQTGPITANMARSVVQHMTSGATQLVSIVAASLVVVLLLFVAVFLKDLPKATLAAIIIISSKGFFLQFKDLVYAFKTNWPDCLIWLGAFGGTVLFDVHWGLLAGVIGALLSHIVRSYYAEACILGEIPNTGIYAELNDFSAAREIPQIKIFRFQGALYFANVQYFKRQLVEKTGFDPIEWHEGQESSPSTPQKMNGASTQTQPESAPDVPRAEWDQDRHQGWQDEAEEKGLPFSYLILDMSGLVVSDVTGIKFLAALGDAYAKVGVTLLFAGPTVETLARLRKAGIEAKIPLGRFFPTLTDAVAFAKWKALLESQKAPKEHQDDQPEAAT